MAILACFLLAAGCAASITPPASAPTVVPASVVVGFDRADTRVLLVEGLADQQAARALTAHDPVRIASVTKLVVTLAVMRLVEQGKLDLDLDVSAYLGWELRNPHQRNVPITLRRLMAHRAGLRDAGDYIIPLGEHLQDRLARPVAWAARDAKGQAEFAYGNINYVVIASVIERASGERFDHLMTRQVLEPLGLDACMNWSGCSDAAVERAVVLYRSNGEVARDDLGGKRPACPVIPDAQGGCDLAHYVAGTNGALFSPQGGLRISALDLARIGQMIARGGDGFLTRASVAEIAQPFGENPAGARFFCRYGLGIQTIGAGGAGCDDDLVGDGVVRIGHGGDAYGLRSGLWLDPITGCGLAYFTTRVPESDAPHTQTEEGGYADEERKLIARVAEKLARCGS